jgi:hypothetical protein
MLFVMCTGDFPWRPANERAIVRQIVAGRLRYAGIAKPGIRCILTLMPAQRQTAAARFVTSWLTPSSGKRLQKLVADPHKL